MDDRYPKEVGIIFSKTEVTPGYISTGLDTVGDAERAEGVMAIGNEWVLINFGVDEPVFTTLGKASLPLDNTIRAYIDYRKRGSSLYDDASAYGFNVVRAPRPNLSMHGRPMYCHNYIYFTLGLEIGPIVTLKHLKRKIEESMAITHSGAGINFKAAKLRLQYE